MKVKAILQGGEADGAQMEVEFDIHTINIPIFTLQGSKGEKQLWQ